MIPEKLEHCPKCGEVQRWNYDAQSCAACGFDRLVQAVMAFFAVSFEVEKAGGSDG